MTDSGVHPVFLTVGDDQNRVTVQLDPLPRRGAMRLAVGEPGFQSGVWRVWSSRNSSDVYIAARNLTSIQKWSLHESGDWRYQWCSHSIVEEFGGGSSDRILDRWERPDEIGRTGWTRGFSIYIRRDDVVEFPTAADQGDVCWIPLPPEGHEVGIHVVIARPNVGEVGIGAVGLFPIGGYVLPNGHVVLVLIHTYLVAEAVTEGIRSHIDRALALTSNPIAWSPTLRMAFSGVDEQGFRWVRDVAPTQADFERARRPTDGGS
ncbi:hypothetical protein [Nocardia higoensis]|uniref:hypothetical protein n=1 Tax=Nocardia higoensis TaxID=228599 RepID=UPI00068771DF|nr:hypothetical protein [Nocardia higoensis]